MYVYYLYYRYILYVNQEKEDNKILKNSDNIDIFMGMCLLNKLYNVLQGCVFFQRFEGVK